MLARGIYYAFRFSIGGSFLIGSPSEQKKASNSIIHRKKRDPMNFPLQQISINPGQPPNRLYYFLMDIEKKIPDLPKRLRGKHLSTFKDIRIETNYHYVKLNAPIEEIYIYKIKFEPGIPADNTQLRLALLQRALPDIRAFIPSPVITGANIFSLKPPIQEQKTMRIDSYDITVSKVKVIPVKENPKTLLMFLNNGLRNMFSKLGYVEIGKTSKFFQVKNSKTIDKDLRMFSGFKANFMWLEKGIYLRVDSAKKIVRNETVLDFINNVYARNKNKERDEKRAALKGELIGQVVMTNYGKTRYVKITDVIFENVDEIKLNGTDTTLRKFYQEKYNRKIENGKQPLIEVESKAKQPGDRCIMVPEMCLMTGIPDDFDEFKRKKISEETIRSPSDKRREIEDFMRQAEQEKNFSSLKELGIEIDKRLNTMTAKLIPCPRLQLGSNKSVPFGKQANFQLFGDPIFESKHSIKVGVFTIENCDVMAMLDVFRRTARNLNVQYQQQVFQIRERDKNQIIRGYFKQIDYAITKCKINIALIVIPSFMKEKYADIKQECLKNLNIVSQCITDKTLQKKNLQSVATKVLLQMIAKRGNVLWVPTTTGKVTGAMIMGFDHAKGKRGNSIVCCATINDTFSSYYSKTSNFSNNEDKFQQMVKLSFQAIDYYSKKNSRCPKEVIIFHNSCTGDQVSLFRNYFLQTLTAKLQESFGLNSMPNISLIMVNTKTNERFFANNGNGVQNVAAGTIVADEIVSQNFDFYLVSQGSNRGSTVPNHYKVVYSNSKIEQGLLHELIFGQCFNYVNWTGSIKIPGILQYAKKCAKFAAEALDGERVKEDLNCKLYFV